MMDEPKILPPEAPEGEDTPLTAPSTEAPSSPAAASPDSDTPAPMPAPASPAPASPAPASPAPPSPAPASPAPPSPAVEKFRSCRWRAAPEDGEYCTHRDVLPFAGKEGFVAESWCPDCAFYKLRRTPKKRERLDFTY